jgi:hypothetical protein
MKDLLSKKSLQNFCSPFFLCPTLKFGMRDNTRRSLTTSRIPQCHDLACHNILVSIRAITMDAKEREAKVRPSTAHIEPAFSRLGPRSARRPTQLDGPFPGSLRIHRRHRSVPVDHIPSLLIDSTKNTMSDYLPNPYFPSRISKTGTKSSKTDNKIV